MPVQTLQRTYLKSQRWGTNGATYFDSGYKSYGTWTRNRSWSHTAYKTSAARARRLVEVGYLPTLPYTDTLDDFNIGIVDARGRFSGTQTFDVTWALGPSNVPYYPHSSTPIANLRLDVLAKLQSKTADTKLNTGVLVGEMGKTVDMFNDCAKRLASSLIDVRRGNFVRAARTLGLDPRTLTPRLNKLVNKRGGATLENVWLEYRYGWRLLLQDLHGALQTYADFVSGTPQVVRTLASGTYSSYWKTTGTFWLTPPGSAGFGVIQYESDNTIQAEVRCGYVFRIENPSLATGTKLGLTNPFLVAWELIPFSFVVDHLVNVGDVLEGFTAFNGKAFLDGFCSISTERTMVSRKTGLTANAGHTFDYCLWNGHRAVARRFERTVLSSFTPSNLRFNFHANIQHGLDAIALVRQIWTPDKRVR